MRLSTSFAALAVPLVASALPMRRSSISENDIFVLQYAQVLEQLESTFYQQGIAAFSSQDFESAGFSNPELVIQQLQSIASDELTHLNTLESVLGSFGVQPINNCQFNFESVLGSVGAMAQAAQLVEQVGVGAYIGAVPLLDDVTLLSSAAGITTVEARHQSFLSILNNNDFISSPFDFGLSPPSVLSLVSPFISGCDLGISGYPSLSLSNPVVEIGQPISFQSSVLSSVDTSGLYCYILHGVSLQPLVLPYNQCSLSQSVSGPIAVYIVSQPQVAFNVFYESSTPIILAGPAIAFVNEQPQIIGEVIESGSGSSIISPAQASQISGSGFGGSSSSSFNSSSGFNPFATGTSSADGSIESDGSSSGSVNVAGTPTNPEIGATAQATPIASSSQSSASSSSISAPVAGQLSVGASAGGANTATGPSTDGSVVVLGWSNVSGEGSASSSTGSSVVSAAAAPPSSDDGSDDSSDTTDDSGDDSSDPTDTAAGSTEGESNSHGGGD